MTPSEKIRLVGTFSQYIKDFGLQPGKDESLFMKAEDVIMCKLYWTRSTVSKYQMRGVESVCEIMKNELDWRYLREWAEKLNVEDLLAPFLPKE